ncbi:MAG: secretin N-terminal domain-containing protein [Magnetococcales bacterium]|nr:secretin N-terminal domain-containing protein [Magnetococcales bacterium]
MTKIRIPKKLGSLLAYSLILGGCITTNPAVQNMEGHLKPPEAVVGDIPEPVIHSPFLTTPSSTIPQGADKEVYTIGVSDMQVRDLLYALARDANLNVDIHPGVAGQVTLNAIDQPLPRILERIAQQVDLQFEVEGETLIVRPDKPYLYTYHVDYINMTRTSTTQLRLTNQIGRNQSGDVSSDKNGNTEGRSTVMVDSESSNQFWETLTSNIRGILGIIEDKQPSADASGDEAAGEGVDGAVDDGVERIRDGMPVDGEGGADAVRPTITKKNTQTPLVFTNPQSGLISVRATARQHAEIQSFLDQVMAGARRQVRIEATVVEVELSDSFQSGVDWSAMRDVGSNRMDWSGTSSVNTGFDADSYGPLEKSVFNLNMLSPGASFGSITGTVHNVTTAVRMLKQFGDVQVLSTPKLVSLNNQIAVLKVVDNEVYFTIEKDARDEGKSITFTSQVHTVPVGLVMNVLPQISLSDEVTLIVRPTITRILGFATDPNPDLAEQNVTSRVPKIQVREMETMLTVRSGQVGVIGGLMTNRVDKSTAHVPVLSSLPVFGNLFKYKDDTLSKTELIVFLRPSVIHSDDDLVNSGEFGALERARTRTYFNKDKPSNGWGL